MRKSSHPEWEWDKHKEIRVKQQQNKENNETFTPSILRIKVLFVGTCNKSGFST